MIEFNAEIHEGKLISPYDSDLEQIKKLKPDTEYSFKVTQPRNLDFHRKLFALLNMMYHNQEQFNNFEDFRAFVTIKSGFYRRVFTGKGEMILPESNRRRFIQFTVVVHCK